MSGTGPVLSARAPNLTLTAVPGVQVGHYTDLEAVTGCTVILCEGGAVAGVDVRGAAPGTRETDLLRPGSLVQKIHALLLAGGSAFGLDAAGGVMRWLEEHRIGFPTRAGLVPIVPAAVLYDLQLGRPTVRPTADWGYAAARVSNTDPVTEGNVGVGTGCSVGKVLGSSHAVKSGLGTWCHRSNDGLIVAALVATNALGNVVDPNRAVTLAGARRDGGPGFVDAEWALQQPDRASASVDFTNTTLAVIATNAPLTREECTRAAQMAHDALAQTIRPVHTQFDGDAIFVLSLSNPAAPAAGLTRVAALATSTLIQAVLRSVSETTSLAGLPAARDLGLDLG